MRYRCAWTLTLAAALAACGGDRDPTGPPGPPPPAGPLKDLVAERLPSPYYHFDYDAAGRVEAVSFASGIRMYRVTYAQGRIAEVSEVRLLGTDTVPTGERLEYSYDDAGRVAVVEYLHSSGSVYTRLVLTYDGDRLTRIERQRSVDSAFVIDKVTALLYYPDGNLLEIAVHRPALDGQEETTTVDLFGKYDDGINVDDFDLLHDEFFDHVVLLPGVRLQKGNAGSQTRIGDGTTFEVRYGYTYDDAGRPRSKVGDVTFSNGPDAGRTVRIRSTFSYY